MRLEGDAQLDAVDNLLAHPLRDGEGRNENHDGPRDEPNWIYANEGSGDYGDEVIKSRDERDDSPNGVEEKESREEDGLGGVMHESEDGGVHEPAPAHQAQNDEAIAAG